MENPNIDELLSKLLALSRLTLDDSEKEEFARKFRSLLEFVDKVNESDITLGIERAEAAGSLSYFDQMLLREDVPREFVWENDYFHRYIVPIVVGGSGSESVDGETE